MFCTNVCLVWQRPIPRILNRGMFEKAVYQAAIPERDTTRAFKGAGRGWLSAAKSSGPNASGDGLMALLSGWRQNTKASQQAKEITRGKWSSQTPPTRPQSSIYTTS